jgi:hypothetical protein
MSPPSRKATKEDEVRGGFDAAAVTRDSDHLNRWPLAREIVGIATTGPQDWSVRAGIYGEWGTGKTSVLRFITQLAEKQGHIVVWFDPWEYSTKAELWRAFVSTVFKDLKAKLGNVPGAKTAKAKRWAERAGPIITGLGAVFNEGAAKAVEGGLDLVKKHFTAGSSDLKEIGPILGDKRVIVLIDDLDRTAPELVPEILFALKELMDIPGFSFICAFDPAVVGEVLGKFHPGFGDGLKFLDKIIDYPRWLPRPSAEGLSKMAIADAAKSCPYVPVEAVADAVGLLPANPRAVRQFIRLLALLKPQVERHHPDELHWRAIVTANVLKVRHPRLAHELLNDESFWTGIGMIGLGVRGEDEKEQTTNAVREHIESVCVQANRSLSTPERNEITSALMSLCSEIGLIGRLTEEKAAYQFNLAENPAAVTWKEFDAFLQLWKAKQLTNTVRSWINQHAATVERTELEVYRELLQATVHRYAEVLQRGDNVFTEAEKAPLVESAESLFTLLETLVFQLGKLTESTKWIGNAELEEAVDKFARMASAVRPLHAQFWPRNEAFIVKLFDQWAADVTPLVRLLEPHLGILRRNFDGQASGELHKKLCAAVLPHFARQIIESFRRDGFIGRLMRHEMETYDARCVVLDVSGPLWTGLRSNVFEALTEASSNRIVQENAYDLLYWLVYAAEGHAPESHTAIQRLFSNQAVFEAVWTAATATQLGPRAVYSIREIPALTKQLGVACRLPDWWAPIVATFTAPVAAQEPEQPQVSLDAPQEPPA